MNILRTAASLLVLVLASTAAAQTPDAVIVREHAPIYIAPDPSRRPLRVASAGTSLRVLAAEGDWYRVEFRDPQWGPRTGYVRIAQVSPAAADYGDMQPMDLSVGHADRASAAPAQWPAPVPPPPAHPFSTAAPALPAGYAMGLGGLSFGTEAAPLAGGEVAGAVSGSVMVYGTFGYHRNVLPPFLQESFDDLSSLLTFATGEPWRFTARTSAWFGIGGVKVLVPTGRRIRPYAQGGVGFAKLGTTIREIDLGDVTDEVLGLAGYDEDDVSPTKAIWEAGGGVSMPFGATYVDVGYRFRRLIDTGEPFNISGVYLGAGVAF